MGISQTGVSVNSKNFSRAIANLNHYDNPNSEPMTIRVDYLAVCQVGELWDVRVWGNDLTALTGEKWYYKFQCRRIKT